MSLAGTCGRLLVIDLRKNLRIEEVCPEKEKAQLESALRPARG
jgi:hypothetical protein